MITSVPADIRFAGYIVTARRELRPGRRRTSMPHVTLHRRLVENCVYSHEMDEPGHWDQFRLDRVLKSSIPKMQRTAALQAVSDLAASGENFGRPNVCFSIAALRDLLGAARLPRDSVQILEAGIPEQFARLVVDREDARPNRGDDREPEHGLVSAMRLSRPMSGQGTLLGIEPWYLDRRLRHSWRERRDTRTVRRRAFAKLNECGLLRDMIDFELFVPGLTPRIGAKRNARWIPLLVAEHSIEAILGDAGVERLIATRVAGS